MDHLIGRAIDIGYGHTKLSLSDGYQTGEIDCLMFPSVAPRATANALSAGFMEARNTVVIDVSGTKYEVGPDAMLAMSTSTSRVLDPTFADSDAYIALVRGALAYMNVPRIDYLVVGLPVSTYRAKAKALRKRLMGEHPVNGQIIEVRELEVVPQPIGGMLEYGIRNNILVKMQGQTSLLIDPGYFTLDWVVTAGLKVNDARSGAHEGGGMSGVLRVIGEHLQTKEANEGRPLELTESVMVRIDESIRKNSVFRLHGEPTSLGPYIEEGRKVAEDALNRMMARVGTMADIDNIILVGGGAHFYLPVLRKRLPGYNILIAHESIFANVRGFQLTAMKRLRDKHKLSGVRVL